MTLPHAPAEDLVDDPEILVVRRGPGANCSSIGSAVEMLFLSAAAGAALVVAASAALRPHADDLDDDPSDEGTDSAVAPPEASPEPRR